MQTEIFNMDINKFNNIKCNEKTLIRNKLNQFKYYDLINYTNLVYDIKYLPINELQNKLYNLNSDDFNYSFSDRILNIPIMDKLSYLEFDKEITLNYYLEFNGTDNCYNAIEYLENLDKYLEVEISSDNYLCDDSISNVINTYNYDSYLSRILQFSYCYDCRNDKYIIALEVHNGYSDARVGYSNVLFYTTDDIEEFLFHLESCNIQVGNCQSIFDVRESETSIYNCDTYDDIYIETYKALECLEALERAGCSIGVYGL